MMNTYRIVIRGRIPDRYRREYQDEFDITATDSITVLVGQIRDASHLHGLVSHLTRAGLELVELASNEFIDSSCSTCST